MGIAILDAASLAKKNKALYEELQQRHSDLDVRTTAESGRQHEERKACQDQALVPFADVFGRIKNVDLVELARFADLPSGAIPNAEVRGVRIDAASILSKQSRSVLHARTPFFLVVSANIKKFANHTAHLLQGEAYL